MRLARSGPRIAVMTLLTLVRSLFTTRLSAELRSEKRTPTVQSCLYQPTVSVSRTDDPRFSSINFGNAVAFQKNETQRTAGTFASTTFEVQDLQKIALLTDVAISRNRD